MERKSFHNILMAAACALPLVLISAIWLLGLNNSYLVYAVLLLCPLSHMLMMKNHSSHNSHNTAGESTAAAEEKS